MMLIFDAILALTLVLLVVQLLFSRELFASVVLFVTFGLLMALAWLRLGAVDIALAEAAIGAGLSGALLLGAVSQMRPKEPRHKQKDSRQKGDR